MKRDPRFSARRLGMALVLAGLGLTVGCAGVSAWGRPGTMAQQQSRASLYDPFPDNRTGPSTPELRPRDFAIPLSEPEKAQLWSDRRRGAGR